MSGGFKLTEEAQMFISIKTGCDKFFLHFHHITFALTVWLLWQFKRSIASRSDTLWLQNQSVSFIIIRYHMSLDAFVWSEDCIMYSKISTLETPVWSVVAYMPAIMYVTFVCCLFSWL